MFILFSAIIEQKANVAQNAGAQCAPLRVRRHNAQFLFSRNIVGARIARPLLEFVQNFGFAHLLFHLSEKSRPRFNQAG